MAKRIVEESSLVSVANAIRTKGETTDSLTFPDGFVTAIGNIQSGGDNYLPGIVDGSLTDITAEMMGGATKIRNYAFYNHAGLKSIVIPPIVITSFSSKVATSASVNLPLACNSLIT